MSNRGKTTHLKYEGKVFTMNSGLTCKVINGCVKISKQQKKLSSFIRKLKNLILKLLLIYTKIS